MPTQPLPHQAPTVKQGTQAEQPLQREGAWRYTGATSASSGRPGGSRGPPIRPSEEGLAGKEPDAGGAAKRLKVQAQGEQQQQDEELLLQQQGDQWELPDLEQDLPAGVPGQQREQIEQHHQQQQQQHQRQRQAMLLQPRGAGGAGRGGSPAGTHGEAPAPTPAAAVPLPGSAAAAMPAEASEELQGAHMQQGGEQQEGQQEGQQQEHPPTPAAVPPADASAPASRGGKVVTAAAAAAVAAVGPAAGAAGLVTHAAPVSGGGPAPGANSRLVALVRRTIYGAGGCVNSSGDTSGAAVTPACQPTAALVAASAGAAAVPQALLPHQSAQVPDVTSAGAQPLAQPQTQLQQVQAQLLAEAPGPQQLQQEGAPECLPCRCPATQWGRWNNTWRWWPCWWRGRCLRTSNG